MDEEQEKLDPKLVEGIAYFEKMLQVMPDDRTTLEFLCVAYEQAGEGDKRRKALVSLANVLLKEKDLEAADRIAERLAQYAEPDAQAAVLRVRAARNPPSAGLAASSDAPAEAGDAARAAAVRAAVKAEVELVQTLAQNKVIDGELANQAMQRLTELASAPGVFLVSALNILEKENSGAGEAAAAYVADTAATPPVPVEAFDPGPLNGPLLSKFPEALLRLRGVWPFATMDKTLLVALLNPFDLALKREIETLAGQPCRFYLAHPRTLEEIFDRLFASRAEAEDGAKDAP